MLRSVTSVSEIIGVFLGCECIKASCDDAPEIVNGACCCLTQESVEFCEDLLNQGAKPFWALRSLLLLTILLSHAFPQRQPAPVRVFLNFHIVAQIGVRKKERDHLLT